MFNTVMGIMGLFPFCFVLALWFKYGGRTQMSGHKSYEEQWKVPGTKSHKTGRTPEYTVSKNFDGTFECSCPNWTQNSPREDCKHILRKQKELGGFIIALKPVAVGGRFFRGQQ